VSWCFSELISRLANLSFNEGQFPSRFKTAQILTLLKKTGLPKSSPANCIQYFQNSRTFVPKPHLILCHFLLQFQSISVSLPLQALYWNCSHLHCQYIFVGHCTLLISFDLSAAFNTVDHNLLVARLVNSFGFRGTFSWIDQISPTGLHSSTLAVSVTFGQPLYSGYSNNPWQYSHWFRIVLR